MLWLLVTALGFQAVPEVRQWGPARTATGPPAEQFVDLAPPPPLGGFLAGRRGNPFGEREVAVASVRPRLPGWNPPRPPEPGPTQPAPTLVPSPPPPPPPPPPPQPTGAEGTKPGDFPARLAGWFKVGGSDGRTVFVVKEDGRHVAVKEGQEIPGLGVRVVTATKNIVIVENEKGKRFQLTDLLRRKELTE